MLDDVDVFKPQLLRMAILFDYTFLRQRKAFQLEFYICFLVEVEEVARVESLYGVHIIITILIFILAAFVELRRSYIDIALGCILILTESSSVPC